jgi:hypothetical protein
MPGPVTLRQCPDNRTLTRPSLPAATAVVDDPPFLQPGKGSRASLVPHVKRDFGFVAGRSSIALAINVLKNLPVDVGKFF